MSDVGKSQRTVRILGSPSNSFHSTTSGQREKVIQLPGNEHGIPIGALTSKNCDTLARWTPHRQVHEGLIGVSGQNGVSLEWIESAVADRRTP